MKNFLITVIISVTMLPAFGQHTNSKKNSLFTYSNPAHHLKLQYPNTWDLTDTISDAIVYVFSPSGDDDGFRENLSITYEDLPTPPIAFKEYVDESLANIKNSNSILDFKEISGKYFMLNGKQAYEINYTGKIKDVELTLSWCQRFLFYKGKAYILTYTAEGDKLDPFAAAAKQVMNSVKFY